MTPTRVRVFKACLHYAPDRVLHTASSGPVTGLEELYLVLERRGEPLGVGGIRINIAYLSGLDPARVMAEVGAFLPALDWSAPPEALLDHVHADTTAPALVRALLDQTLHDWVARRAGVPLHALLAGVKDPADAPTGRAAAETNQTLFWCDDATLMERASAYVARGFTTLKLRVGVAPLAHDLARLRALREAFGPRVALSADANGQWNRETATAALPALGEVGLDYLEQPLPANDWAGLRTLAERAKPHSLPIMLDESLGSWPDVERLAALGDEGETGLAGHLKLVKTGGIRPLIAAARALKAAGIRVMVGQMNEGALATAAIAHCAVALGTHGNELYGADGLIDDPAHTANDDGPNDDGPDGLDYDGGDGRVRLPSGPGLGLTLSLPALTPILEVTP
ncbi:mandelate racemase [Roseospira marina]|uniref:Mandelate racemase n=1 Tax=Roseospira marina TaxID=140057 RepID=A0A5M6IFS3_9PROT|nr:enolase C-terminal domain-like protein [Roseospira marina]KAA5606599.1 mandelate racemase [Roseospira marina]MBB4313999.1 L-alanine-DL-glutamate epimerase-like enolase superfamily enzyme [Roseospira marina]MBB5087161.1 L-alanine-DL-glutamate epimerase-like enolase superfamily enzyme [Roseospira marina]